MAIKFSIPPLGTKIRLAEAWKFPLYGEHRNDKLVRVLFPGKAPENEWRYKYPVDVIGQAFLPPGTELAVARIYIRQGLKGFDSVTFRITGGDKKFKGCRFWAKLADVNRIVCDPVSGTEDNKEAYETFSNPGLGSLGSRVLEV